MDDNIKVDLRQGGCENEDCINNLQSNMASFC